MFRFEFISCVASMYFYANVIVSLIENVGNTFNK